MKQLELSTQTTRAEEGRLIAALRDGDEEAFEVLAARYSPAMLAAAVAYVGSEAAEAIVRDAWRAALEGVDRFEDSVSLRTWLMRDVIMRSVAGRAARGRGAPRNGTRAGEGLLSSLREAIAELPPRQRLVISLRDIEGWSAREVAETLGISAESQRMLLDRARRRVHAAVAAPTARRAA